MDRLLVLAGIVVAVIVMSSIARALLRRRHAIAHIDLADIADADGQIATVVFTSPFCHGCRQWIEALGEGSLQPYAIDIGARPDAAARYKINTTPRVAVVRTSDGTVLREFDHYTPRQHDLDAISRLISTA